MEREELQNKYGQVWNTRELQEDFEVEAFSAPFVIVRRRSDNRRGSLEFEHSPRYYHSFAEV